MKYSIFHGSRKITDPMVGNKRVVAIRKGSQYAWRRAAEVAVRLGNTKNAVSTTYILPFAATKISCSGKAYRLSSGYCTLTIAINGVSQFTASGDKGGKAFSTELSGDFKKGDEISVTTSGKYHSGYADVVMAGFLG